MMGQLAGVKVHAKKLKSKKLQHSPSLTKTTAFELHREVIELELQTHTSGIS